MQCNRIESFQTRKHHRRRNNYKAGSLRSTPIRYATIFKLGMYHRFVTTTLFRRSFTMITPRMYRHNSRPIEKPGRCERENPMSKNWLACEKQPLWEHIPLACFVRHEQTLHRCLLCRCFILCPNRPTLLQQCYSSGRKAPSATDRSPRSSNGRYLIDMHMHCL